MGTTLCVLPPMPRLMKRHCNWLWSAWGEGGGGDRYNKPIGSWETKLKGSTNKTMGCSPIPHGPPPWWWAPELLKKIKFFMIFRINGGWWALWFHMASSPCRQQWMSAAHVSLEAVGVPKHVMLQTEIDSLLEKKAIERAPYAACFYAKKNGPSLIGNHLINSLWPEVF